MPDLVPAANAELYWKDGDRDLPDRLVVIDGRSGSNPVTGATRDHVEHLDNSAGALIAGWMTDADPLSGTPEAFFAAEFLDRMSERAVLRGGLAALAQIAEREWARQMLATFEELDRRRA